MYTNENRNIRVNNTKHGKSMQSLAARVAPEIV
jgi:hypothetical protein